MVDTSRVPQATAAVCIAMSLAACTGGVHGDVSSVAASSSPQYTVGGTVSGLSGSGLVLATNTGETLAVAADGSFTFKTTYPAGSPYYVLVLSQPSTPTQTCLSSNGAGTIANANVTSIAIACQDKTTPTDAIGGVIVGLTGTGLVLQNNGTDTLSIAANGAFAFPGTAPSGSPYNISVLSPPINPYEDCQVLNGQGTTADSDIANIGIVCTVNPSTTHTIGGTVSGVSGTLVLQDNGRDDLTITANGAFTFPLAIPSGSSYDVTTKSTTGGQSQACLFTNATGTVGDSNITDVTITCNANVTLQASVSGLAGTGLTLRNTSDGDNLAVTANGPSTFATGIVPGDPYNVTVVGQPINPSQTCVVANAAGTASSGSTVSVTCTTNTYTVGGVITGLPDPNTSSANPGANLVLQDNLGDTFTTSATGTSPISFTFATPIASGSTYSVTVTSQPGLSTAFGTPGVVQTTTVCVLAAGTGSGTVTISNVTNVTVNCVRPAGFAYVINSGDNTVSSYVIDSASGALLPSGPPVSTGNAPSSAAADGGGDLYVSNSGSNNLSGYRIDPNTGTLTPLAGSPLVIAGLNTPTSVAASFPWLYASNPIGPPSISAATISTSGTLTNIGGSPFAAQVGPTGGAFFAGSQNSYYLGANSSSNTFSAYLINNTTGALSPVPGSPAATGTAPDSVIGLRFFISGTAVSDNAYVVNSGSGTISIFNMNIATGTPTPLASGPVTVEAGLSAVTGQAGFTCGCYVFASGPQGVWAYTTDQTGVLTPQPNNPYAGGAGPGAIATVSSYVYLVNTTDQTISVFQIGATGALTPVTGALAKTGKAPSSIVVILRPTFG
ncbi:MAG: hypothetical protein JO042_14050 [Sinobacteraceae bacterium]|nr:hypothetical protein [Nevskiaceae bacterium]